MAKKSSIRKIVLICVGVFIILIALSIFVPAVGPVGLFFPVGKFVLEKTHYKGVDCGLVNGTVSSGDLVIDQKRVCLGERAWFENNPVFCEEYEFLSVRDQCYVIMAAKLGDVSLCKKVRRELEPVLTSFLNEQGLKDTRLYECYYTYAKLRGDPDICDTIPFRALSPYEFNCKTSLNQYTPLDLELKTSPIN